MMEVCVQLKVCEGCGCLWYRSLGHPSVYCSRCKVRLRDFRPPDARRSGRKSFKSSIQTAADAGAGAH